MHADVATKHNVNLGAFDKLHRKHICRKLHLRSMQVAAIRPCTSLQAGMMSQLLHSGGSSYLYHSTFQLKEDVDLEDLRDAWDVVLEKYEMLRTGFTTVEDLQHPFAMITYRARAVDSPVRLLSEANVDARVLRHQAGSEIVSRPHNLPWRVALWESNGAKLMDLSIFHGIYDATSLRLMLSDVIRTYQGNLPLALPTSIDKALIKIMQGNLSRDPDIEDYWKSSADQLSVSRFPELSPLRSSHQKLRTCRQDSSRSLSELSSQCRQAHVTMQAASLAAWARVLSAYLGESIVTVGTVLSGRTENATEDAPFPCVATVPVSINTSQDDAQLLQSLMHITARSQSSQFVPLADIQRWVGHDRDALFDTLFAYQKQEPSDAGVHAPWIVVDEDVSLNVMYLIPAHFDQLLTRTSIPCPSKSNQDVMMCSIFASHSVPIDYRLHRLHEYCLKWMMLFKISWYPQTSIGLDPCGR